MGSNKPKPHSAGSTSTGNDVNTISRRIFLAGVVAVTSGCQNLVKRGQSIDDEIVTAPQPTTHYIASVCKMAGLRGEKIESIALVTQLNATGSPAKPGEIRNRLERALERLDLEIGTEKLLKSKDTEIVFCRGFLPPGARKGDPFDLEVQGLRDSEATSLENGFVITTHLRDTARLGKTVKAGHLKAVGSGRIITDEALGKSASNLQGIILGGGKARVDRDLTLLMRSGSSSIRTATQVSGALNSRFTIAKDGGLENVAEAKTDQVVELKIPRQYRHSVGRYAQVVSNVAFGEIPTALADRLDRLEQEMKIPATAGLAAVRLEGIGQKAVPTLNRAMKNPQLPTKFYAAQALAYIGNDDGVAVLVEAAIQEPAFRWQALTALATLDNGRSEQALIGLLNQSEPETRYGAFRALRLQNPNHPVVQGQWLANDHHLCIVDNESEPMLHFANQERAEVLVFNNSQTFSDQFLYVQTGLTVKSDGDGTVSVATFRADDSSKKVCSDRVSDVFQTLAQSGYGYSTLLRIARQSQQDGTLNARLEVDATPKVSRQYRPNVVQNTQPPVIQDSQVQPASWWSSIKGKFAR